MFNFIKKSSKYFFLILFGIVLSLILCEIFLQVLSYYNGLVTSLNKKQELIKDKDSITIMCIGESTTKDQYPQFLEKKLNDYCPNIKFNIIDCGYACIMLDDLYFKIRDDIDLYMPDIVVGMIGINDMIDYTFQSFSKIRIIYLLQLIQKHYRLKKYSITEDKIIETNNNINNNTDNYDYEDGHYESAKAEEVLEQISKLINVSSNNASMSQIIDKNLEDELLSIYGMDKEFLKVFIKAYCSQKENNLTVDDILVKILHDDSIKKEFKYGFCGIYNMLNKNYNLGKRFLVKADNERLKYDYEYISGKYEKILDLIIPKDIKYIAMQYPVRDVSSLKKIIYNTKYKNNVYFVSNKDNFRNALQTEKRGEIFHDFFAWDFGHCKEYGNMLIADNLAKEIKNLLYNKEGVK